MNTLSPKEKAIILEYSGRADPLPFPLKEVATSDGGTTCIYDIPTDQKMAVIEQLYFLEPVPKEDAILLDLHSERRLMLKDAIVVREDGVNFIASPYYPESGGTLLDFAEESDFIDGRCVIIARAVKGRHDSVLADNISADGVSHANLPLREDEK